MLGVGNKVPQVTVILAGAVIVGNAAGLTVITLETEVIVRPQLSVAVQVSVTVPPHAFGSALKVERLEVPEIKQPPPKPLLKLIVLGAGMLPQVTVIAPGAVMVGNAAGLTVMVRETAVIGRPQLSVAVQVSVTVPPQAPGVVLNVERFDVPEIWQPPLRPLL